jgi:hypothetical protein
VKPADLEWVDQSASDLLLRIFASPLDRSCLTVLRETTFDCHGFRIWAAIIGSSHALHVVADNGGQLSELCSCQDAGRTSRPMKSVRLFQRRHHIEAASGALGYAFHSATLPWEEGRHRAEKIRDVVLKSRKKSNETGLLFSFPTIGDRSPYTAVNATAVRGCVRIDTVHAYPNEDNIVLTTSIFTSPSPEPLHGGECLGGGKEEFTILEREEP